MANRIFDLKETKGAFQVKGKISGVDKDRFYTAKKTKTGKDFRAVNFGCEYDSQKTVYLALNGMPQNEVYYSKRDNETKKTETKRIPWANRYQFNEDGFRMIGVNLGLTKTTNEEGKSVNDRKTMHAFDACEHIKANLRDDMSVFIKGNLEFSSFIDGQNNTRRSLKYVPSQISLCKDVDFDEYDEDNKPTHDFTQTIMFMGIDKERESNKDTGRFVVSAKIVTYNDIVDTEFIITDAKLAGLFKKNLKPYNAINVFGRIDVVHSVQVISEDDGWGEANAMERVSAPTRTEMIITGAAPTSIDRELYSEESVAEAIAKIRASKTAEQNFSGKAVAVTVDDWGDDTGFDEETPW